MKKKVHKAVKNMEGDFSKHEKHLHEKPKPMKATKKKDGKY